MVFAAMKGNHQIGLRAIFQPTESWTELFQHCTPEPAATQSNLSKWCIGTVYPGIPRYSPCSDKQKHDKNDVQILSKQHETMLVAPCSRTNSQWNWKQRSWNLSIQAQSRQPGCAAKKMFSAFWHIPLYKEISKIIRSLALNKRPNAQNQP